MANGALMNVCKASASSRMVFDMCHVVQTKTIRVETSRTCQSLSGNYEVTSKSRFKSGTGEQLGGYQQRAYSQLETRPNLLE
jgi:nitrate reductase alpha subunit